MGATRGHVTATRQEYPAGGRNVRVMIRLACSVCEGTGLAGSPTEEAALDFAELVDWHAQCQRDAPVDLTDPDYDGPWDSRQT